MRCRLKAERDSAVQQLQGQMARVSGVELKKLEEEVQLLRDQQASKQQELEEELRNNPGQPTTMACREVQTGPSLLRGGDNRSDRVEAEASQQATPPFSSHRRRKSLPTTRQQRLERIQAAAASESPGAAARREGARTAHVTGFGENESPAAEVRVPEEQRRVYLQAIFKLFDLDDSGTVSREELEHIAAKRREMSTAAGSSTPTDSVLFDEICPTDEHELSRMEFCDYFSRVLPQEVSKFKEAIYQFTVVAEECRLAKTPRSSKLRRKSRTPVL